MQFDEKKIRQLINAIGNIIAVLDNHQECRDENLEIAIKELLDIGIIIEHDYAMQGE